MLLFDFTVEYHNFATNYQFYYDVQQDMIDIRWAGYGGPSANVAHYPNASQLFGIRVKRTQLIQTLINDCTISRGFDAHGYWEALYMVDDLKIAFYDGNTLDDFIEELYSRCRIIEALSPEQIDPSWHKYFKP